MSPPCDPIGHIVGGTAPFVVPYGARGNTATEICAKEGSAHCMHAIPIKNSCARQGERRRSKLVGGDNLQVHRNIKFAVLIYRVAP